MISRRNLSDSISKIIFFMSGVFSLIVVLCIFIFLVKESFPVYQDISIYDFILSAKWNPDGWSGEYYGILSLVWGTLFVTIITLIISIPLGVLTAVFLAEIAPEKVQMIFKPAIELLAGIPSVVLGFFGIVLLGPFIAKIFGLSNGLNVLNGSILLSIMVLPTIISMSEDAIIAVPKSYRDASLAMGATKLETIIKVVLPAASSGIIASIMLGMGRAIGETMAVLMACGNAPALTKSIFDSVRTLTATIAIEMGEVAFDTTHYYALFHLGLFLFIISFFINNVAQYFINKGIRHEHV
ncbi:MAG: phosphate ABC transporter permease subunit PstC [Candidatus Margulisbacteria bacterium GWF2_35_9]|nr:MAG: phosphate ABC transporter permease subunit PstC [Candidatus Margulisbacteria bacterium GWF2_35_9]